MANTVVRKPLEGGRQARARQCAGRADRRSSRDRTCPRCRFEVQLSPTCSALSLESCHRLAGSLSRRRKSIQSRLVEAISSLATCCAVPSREIERKGNPDRSISSRNANGSAYLSALTSRITVMSGLSRRTRCIPRQTASSEPSTSIFARSTRGQPSVKRSIVSVSMSIVVPFDSSPSAINAFMPRRSGMKNLTIPPWRSDIARGTTST